MRTDKTGILVFGGHFHSLGLIRNMARKHIPVALFDHEVNISRFSRYVDAFFKCPSCHEEKRLYDFLVHHAEVSGLRGSLIFPSDDEAVHFFSRYKSKLQDHYIITTPDWKTCRYAYNKKFTYRMAKQIGVPIPMTWFPESGEDLPMDELTYPVLIKPAVMRTFFKATGCKVFRAKDEAQLRGFYRKACQCIPGEEILIQEEIPCGADYLYSFCPFYKNGETHSFITARRIRQHPLDFGHASTYVETVDVPEIKVLGERFLGAIDYYGVCEVEFMQDTRDGEFKMLEVNPRVWGWHSICNAAGVYPFYDFYLDLTGRPFGSDSCREGAKWMRLLTDIPTAFEAMIRKRLSPGDYLRQLTEAKELSVFDPDDPVPSVAEILMIPYLWHKRGY